jgi:hypothetical protein
MIPRRDTLQLRAGRSPLAEKSIPALETPNNDPLSYFTAIVRGEIKPSGLSSLEINMIATEILDAAKRSAETGRRIDLKK